MVSVLFVCLVSVCTIGLLFTPTKSELTMIRECKRRLQQAHDDGDVWVFGTTSPIVLLGVTLFSRRRQFRGTRRRIIAGVATYTNGDSEVAVEIAARIKRDARRGHLAFVAVTVPNKAGAVVMAAAGPEGVDANGATVD